MQTEDDQQQIGESDSLGFRDVTSTAKLFNFRCSVYISARVWEDCVELTSGKNNKFNELIVLQRLRHVLFMAASVLHGRLGDFEQEFCVYRIPSQSADSLRKPESVMLKLLTKRDEHAQSFYCICLPDE